jgi:uncharacterized protein YndB with AHSA1/START domain
MSETEPEVVLIRTFRASAEALYDAWTDPALLQRWLAPGPCVVEHAETDLRIGGRFELRTRSPNGDRHRISGRYRTLQRGRLILKTWIYDGPLDLLSGAETLLRIDFAPLEGGSTELRLTHSRITRPDVRAAYREDWPSCFDKLPLVLN